MRSQNNDPDLGRVLVLADLPGRWSAGEPKPANVQENGVQSWVDALQATYWGPPLPTKQQLRDYDLVLANLNPRLLGHYLRLIDKSGDGPHWVGIVEGDGFSYTSPVPFLPEVLDRLHLVLAINPMTLPLFRSLTKTRVEYCPIPYPIELVAGIKTPVESRRQEVLCCPQRDKLPSILVARAAGLPVKVHLPKTSRKVRNLAKIVASRGRRWHEADRYRTYLRDGDRVVLGEFALMDFLRLAGESLIWMNLDRRTTWTRYVVDGAALGVPVIAPRSAAQSQGLFPSLCVDSVFDIEDAARMARTLSQSRSFYDEVVGRAAEKLPEYGFDRCRQRLVALLRQGRPGKSTGLGKIR